MKFFALALLVIGTVIGTLGGARLPAADPLIAGVGLLLLTSGAILIRISKGSGGAEAVTCDDEMSAALRSISALPRETEELRRTAPGLDLPEIIRRIDRINVDHLQLVGDAIPGLLESLGSRAFAELMGNFSSGERLLARAWSAAADNHRSECMNSIEKALKEFKPAADLSDGILKK